MEFVWVRSRSTLGRRPEPEFGNKRWANKHKSTGKHVVTLIGTVPDIPKSPHHWGGGVPVGADGHFPMQHTSFQETPWTDRMTALH